MMKHTKRVIIFGLGIFLLIFGIIGLALPFLQGIIFILVGLLLLSTYSPRMREWLDSHTRKYPKVHSWVIKIQQFINRVVGDA